MEPTLSAINKALSELAEKESPSELTRAEIPSITRSKPWLWLVGGFSLSLAVGGWAVSQGPTAIEEVPLTSDASVNHIVVETSPVVAVSHSPTNKVTPQLDNVVYTQRIEKPKVTVQLPVVEPAPEVDDFAPRRELSTAPEQPILLASLNNGVSRTANVSHESSMRIEQVELTHQQLAEKALARADKAMDANDMKTALSAFGEALRYQPTNLEARQKLAALYFGKGDTRKAYEILQTGISLDPNNQPLRLALSKLLVKADQPEAALSPLVHLPPTPSRDYLAMRAALAQKQKQNDIALESYQLLTQREPENARWWLGLAIQQERALAFTPAIASYQKALGKVGISNQSQAFIRDRLNILKQLENAQ
ncbi:tetratricopeptide repeat protein [Vibrio campbellii]|uniref:tetratricopeptide repeat protein n=1 Tax=Vibrio campbellii TaxID=680 RepID=UPI000CD331AC|nr:tetratricopeptide repeat protein [Vibrio campbellii]AUW03858.1 MSHA biogenesis protein MshN [Vibrio campbellii]